MARRDYLLLTIGAAAIAMTASADVRIEGPRQTVAIQIAAGGLSVDIGPDEPDEDEAEASGAGFGLSGLSLLGWLVSR